MSMSLISYTITLISLIIGVVLTGVFEIMLWKKEKKITEFKKSVKKNKRQLEIIQKQLERIKLYKILGAFLIAILTLLSFSIQKDESIPESIINHDEKSQKRFETIIAKIEDLKKPDTLLTKVQNSEGYSAFIKLNRCEYRIKKTLFRIVNKLNEIEVFLNEDNELVYKIVDTETYTLKVKELVHKISSDKAFFFLCEQGSSKEYSYMRLFIDKKEVGRLNINSEIQFPHFDESQVNMGLKINNDNCNFDFYIAAINKGPLYQKEINGLYNSYLGFYYRISGIPWDDKRFSK